MINTAYLLLLFLKGTWSGGSYYVFQFSKTYYKKFEAKIRQEWMLFFLSRHHKIRNTKMIFNELYLYVDK